MSVCNCTKGKYEGKREKREYVTFNYPGTLPGDQTLLTGIRRKTDSSKVYISGFYVPADASKTTSFVYKGCICGKGKFHNLNICLNRTITNLYGPNNGELPDEIQVVGNYNNKGGNFGCLYEGLLDGSGIWTTITPPQAVNTICHSTMGGLVVGNYDTELVMNRSKAFIYDISTKKFVEITNPEAVSISAYGIWHNGDSSYTICGGYAVEESKNNAVPRTVAYIVDWDHAKQRFSNWQIFHFDNNPEEAFVTHFDGITGGETERSYNLTGDWAGVARPSEELGFFAVVKRKCDSNKFHRRAKWSSVSFPKQPITSGNSVLDNIVIGVYTSGKEGANVNGYVSNVVCD